MALNGAELALAKIRTDVLPSEAYHRHGGFSEGYYLVSGKRDDCAACDPKILRSARGCAISVIRDQENRILVAIDDLVEFLNVMGED